MSKVDKLFTSAGITIHGDGVNKVSKVRFGTDIVRQVKMLQNPKKIEIRGVGCQAPIRVDIVSLPEPMTKMQALQYLTKHENFQSSEDQALIADSVQSREPKIPKRTKSKKNELSIDSIKARVKTVSVEDILSAVKETV